MSDIIAQYPQVAASKWYSKFDHVSYSRPNFDDVLSPLNSLTFSPGSVDKERRARKILRKLLDEQADINEGLADENDVLQVQQKALLQLLISKDRQLEGFSMTTASSIMTSAGKHSSRDRWEPLGKASVRLIYRMLRRTVWKWKTLAQHSSLSLSLKNAGTARLIAALVSGLTRQKSLVFKQMKVPKSVLKMIRIVRGQILAAGFLGFRAVVTRGKQRRLNGVAKLMVLLERKTMKTVLKAYNRIYQSSGKDVKSQLRLLSRTFKKGFGRLFRRWKDAANAINLKKIREEKQTTITKVTEFSKRFLKLNQLCTIFWRRRKFVLARKVLLWRAAASKTGFGSIISGINHLQAMTARAIRRLAWRKISRKPSLLLPRTVKNLFFHQLRSALVTFVAHCTAGSQQEKKERMSQLDSEMEGLQERLNATVNEKEKIAQKVGQLTKRCSDLEARRDSLEREQGETKQELDSARVTIKDLTIRTDLRKADFDKKEASWILEQKRWAEEQATQRTLQSRLEGQYAQCMHEKAKLMSSENEQRKQLITLTATIDRFAEDREELQQRLAATEQALQQAKDQLDQVRRSPVPSQKKETALEAKVKDLESALQNAQLTYETKATQKQKEVQGLQQLCQDLKAQVDQAQKTAVNASEKDATKRLTKENGQLSTRVEELQREMAITKATNSQLSSQVLKLNKEIADLKVQIHTDRVERTKGELRETTERQQVAAE